VKPTLNSFNGILGGYVTTGVDELVRHPGMLTKMVADVEEVSS
jgi:hypothetical protein